MALLRPACRVIVDPTPSSGAWNMAVDEALLEAAVARDECSLRWYGWARPTVSLGYFQDPASAPLPPELRVLPCVRRLSGGGAIVHDRELTYSCAVPALHALARVPRDLYTHVHQQFIDVLTELGIPATQRESPDSARSREFLCFARGDGFDVMLGRAKIVGSAQRRRKGAVLQHGSLVLERSPHAPQFPGLFDLTGVAVVPAELLRRLSERVGRLLSDEPVFGSLNADETARASTLACERYANPA